MKSIEEIVNEIKEKNTIGNVTPRMLFGYVGYVRRTSNGCKLVDKFLRENELEVNPHYKDVWPDEKIELRLKEKAKKIKREDPIKRLGLLQAANTMPITVCNNDKIEKAITLMLLNDYSQLPVMNGPRKIVGHISWQTIGEAVFKGIESDIVKDYTSQNIKTFQKNTPLLQSIQEIYKNNFIVVTEADGSPCGIVTTTDISSQFLIWTEPFVMLEQIENLIRHILDDKILLEDLKNVCQETDRDIESIDDLTFGEYISIFENTKYWEKINLTTIDKTLFVKSLHEVREIRNDIMHFDPEGIEEESCTKLKNILDFLKKLANLD